MGEIEPCGRWTPIEWGRPETVEWRENPGYEVFQDKGKVQGRLIGGCCGPLRQIMGTRVFPTAEMWKDAIVFLECPSSYGERSGLHELRAFAAAGVFRLVKGMICACTDESEKKNLARVIREEEGLSDFPILLNVDFGHRTPMTVLPIGAMAEIDCEHAAFRILEPGVD